jgi:hypothetical protein
MYLPAQQIRKYLLTMLFAVFILLASGCSVFPGSPQANNDGTSVNGSGGSSMTNTSTMENDASIIQRHGSAIAVSPGSSATSSISCEGNEQIVGGGYYISGDKGSAVVSYPSSLESWVSTLHNTTNKAQQISAFVNCLQANFSIRSKLIIGTVQGVNAGGGNKTLTVVAQCPSGSILTGGGYLTETFTGTIDTSAPDNDQNQWLVVAHTTGNGSMKVQSFAICATAHLKAISPRLHSAFTIPAGKDVSSTYSCPENALLTSGGYTTADATAPEAFYAISSPDTVSVSSPGPVTQWMIGGTSYDDKAHQASIWLVCLNAI